MVPTRTWTRALAAGLGLALLPGLVLAQPAPLPGRYLPLYPALYGQLSLETHAGERSFDAQGEERDSALPQLEGQSRLPEQRAEAQFLWTFPMFETLDLPFFSSRLHTARLRIGYGGGRVEGALADFVADRSDDASTQADNLVTRGNGLSDLELEFGSFLTGTANWKQRESASHALLLLAGARLPTGTYERDGVASAGGNTASFTVRLALHARPWRGALLDAGFGERAFLKNQDPAFGGLHPVQPGDRREWDLSLAQRVWPGWYLGVFGRGHDGDANLYENPRFSVTPPEPPPNGDTYPTPGLYRDAGTHAREAGLSLSWLIGARWKADLLWSTTLDGESGEFDLPYTERQPAGCTPGSTGCSTTPGETVRVDGLGGARVLADDRLMLSLQYQFGQGDAFTCLGCER
ncbi:MAG TPA: transporter [Nevskiaceae bacterium]|nr:transporter [Nevskiaceae bacterium]